MYKTIVMATAVLALGLGDASARGGGSGGGGGGNHSSNSQSTSQPVHGPGSSHNPIVYHPVHGPGSSHNPIVSGTGTTVVRDHRPRNYGGPYAGNRYHGDNSGSEGGVTVTTSNGQIVHTPVGTPNGSGFNGNVHDHR